MFSKRNTALRVLIASCSASLLVPGGCAMPSRSTLSLSSPVQARPALPSERVASTEDTSTERKPDSLKSVAEFLARTSEYQLAGSPAVYVPKPPAIQVRKHNTTPTPLTPAANGLLPSGRSEGLQRERLAAVQADTNAAIALPDPLHPSVALPIVQSVTIAQPPVPVSTKSAVAATSTVRNIANQPLGITESKPTWTIDSVLKRLKQQANETGDLDTVWPLKFTQLAFLRDNEAAEMPTSLSASARAILGPLMRLVPAVRGVARDASTPGNEALDRLDEMRRILADRSDPVVSHIVLCRKVVTFGVYDEIAPSDLVAGRENQAIVYSEIRNLRAEHTDDDRYVSRIGTRLEVLTAEGQSVWQHEEPDIVDESRNRRTDFFVAERIALPSTLAAGDYVLKVMVQDKLSERMHEASTPFVITSAQTVASRSGS